MVNDKLKSAALLRCGICGWRDVKWRCLDERCPCFTDFKFYDLCTSGIHGEHEHLIMTPEDRRGTSQHDRRKRWWKILPTAGYLLISILISLSYSGRIKREIRKLNKYFMINPSNHT